MDERKNLGRLLAKLEGNLKQLEIRYEQYFAGVEKREPIKEREQVAKQLRQFINRRIIQTDLRFKCQNLSTRFHSYCNYWDRILRKIEEGRYHRGKGQISSPPKAPALNASPDASDLDQVYNELVQAHSTSGASSSLPDKEKVAAFLDQQRSRIREKYGDQEIEFHVTTENGKPKIKARAK